jgi:hypothetical protein
VSPRRIEVEIDALVVDDPRQARRAELAVGLERELAANRELSAALGDDLSAEDVSRAIVRAAGRELAR